MTVGEIIDRFYSRVPSDDLQPRPRVVYNKMLTARALLLNRRYSKGKTPSGWVKQTIDCIPVEKTTPAECNCHVPDQCQIYRTIVPIPETLMGSINVLSDDAYTHYYMTTFDAYQYRSHMKYTGDRPQAFLKNQYLYITKKGILGDIAINGVFVDPVQAASMPSICDSNERPCISAQDVMFNIDPDMIDPLVEMLFVEFFGKVKQIPEDESNNAQDNNP